MHSVSYRYRRSHIPDVSNLHIGRRAHGSRLVRRRERHYYSRGSGRSYVDGSSGATYHVYGRGGHSDSHSHNNGFHGSSNGSNGHNNGHSPHPSPSSREPRQPNFSGALTVTHVDLVVTQNGLAHHTDRYQLSSPSEVSPKLVIRRGQPFTIQLAVSRPYDASKDDLKLVFEAGDDPSSMNGTYVEIILSDKDLPNKWGAKIVKNQGNQLSVQVFTPPSLFVGKWDFSVDVVDKKDTNVEIYKYEHDDPIYVIFNPWCKDDDVYMDEPDQRQEYVMNESGFIYMGTQSSISERPWNFGQFASVILDVAMYLLDESDIKWEVRGNPVAVVRKLSAMINEQDDDGVLAGRWQEPYAPGRSPLSWSGSVKILEKFWHTKQPVQHGQCWVFSGVSTTVCRALGIPTRSVTNFQSAHDTDGSVTIDTFLDRDGHRMDTSRDSVWNFHVWNEAWMARRDLPAGFGGWQAFDATPQETSDGIYCCGPASVEAIKQGAVHLPYDTAFLFAEVNADRVYWQTTFTGKLEPVGCKKHEIGKHISTKFANDMYREDVTNRYKFEEGSAKEREAVRRANQTASNRPGVNEVAQDISCNIEQDAKNTWVGGDFEVTLHMHNGGQAVRTVSGRVTVSTMYYTGVIANALKTDTFRNIVLKPGQETRVKTKVTAREYDGKLKDCCMLDVAAFASVQETGQRFADKESFRLRKPHLVLQAPKKARIGEEYRVQVSFSNPLDVTLANCFLEVDGLTRPYKYRLANVGPRVTLMTDISLVPERKGPTNLVVIFNSDQLEDINGTLPIVFSDS